MTNLTLIRSCTLFGMFSVAASSFAQESAIPDTIFFRDGHRLAVLMDEIGLDAIIYHAPSEPLRLSVARSEVARVKLHNGQTLEFAHEPMNAQLPPRASAKKHVIKFDILSPAANHVVLGYEQVLRPWMNVEAKVGLIGVGIAKKGDINYSGIMLKAGMKFISRPAAVVRGMRLNSLLQGAYVKPELIFTSYTSKLNEDPGSGVVVQNQEPVKSGDFAFNMVIGKQHMLGAGVTVDIFFGLGFGSHWDRTKEDVNKDASESNAFGVLIGNSSMPIALSGGITFGVAF